MATVTFDVTPAHAAGNSGGGGGSDNGGGGGSDNGGGGGGGNEGGSGSSGGSGNAGGSDGSGASGSAGSGGQQGQSGGRVISPDLPIVPDPDSSSSRSTSSGKAPAAAPVQRTAPASSGTANQGGAEHEAAGSHGGSDGEGGQQGEYTGGQMIGQTGGGTGKPMTDLFLELTGEDDDSDRPEWAGVPGGRDGAGGGQPDNAGSTKGDLFGDLYVILRNDQGVPILSEAGYVQPVDAEGNLIKLDEDGHPEDEELAQEVEIGRLNVGRAPTSVLDRRADEVITLLKTATEVTTDAAGRLVLTVDDVTKTIDSPLENLAIYVSLMTTGTIPGVDDLPGDAFDFMVDGALTAEDVAGSVAFLAAATDKTGDFSEDQVAYLNAFVGINTVSVGSVTYSDIDYSDFTYDRVSTYGDVTANVLVQQPDGSWLPETVNIYEVVFGSTNVSDQGTLTAWTLAADDALTVVDYIHEYEVPVIFQSASN
ncbi:hypothetical protein [Sagittula salina]|uniref:Uncharacterized protein n=1 Tax=Sagittula salina TaxID=2820268 RepID=A0A940MRI1_9RHOB|nr:hypothetical protein [Sagittula salina]MBP0481709.1 hypothetical protein [Sagittula salina]